MEIKATVDISGVKRKVSDGQMRIARAAVADQILADSDRFVPNRDGELRASGHVANGGAEIVWGAQYAKVQYNGMARGRVFRKYTTPGTGSKWYEKAEKAYSKQWEETAVDALGVK